MMEGNWSPYLQLILLALHDGLLHRNICKVVLGNCLEEGRNLHRNTTLWMDEASVHHVDPIVPQRWMQIGQNHCIWCSATYALREAWPDGFTLIQKGFGPGSIHSTTM